ncbi:hypothetical protein HGRIS_003370 [Hohenbuehelia grisea]|uniref:Uncharacterized protein n=1 Tax=Hohenbuehelia grisea TaxID=104357 RepID=A0ABR3JGV8_9AGAR
MLVVFQRKIIYMGYCPPGARAEDLKRDVPPQHLKGLRCEEISVPSTDSVMLSGIVVSRVDASEPPKAVIVYFQGNAGNPLHRLPVFHRLLHHPYSPSTEADQLAIVSVAPRSYWKSTRRRPTERGILMDYLYTLRYTLDRFPSAKVIFYGHSLGGAAAVCLSSQLYVTPLQISDWAHEQNLFVDARYAKIQGLVLENPFVSIPEMVRALYPERWVPYRYLAPLAFDKWDALAAMRRLYAERHSNEGSDSQNATVLKRVARDMLMLLSEKDEVVPCEMGTSLFDLSERGRGATAGGLGRKVIIKDALHENAWQQRQWSKEMGLYARQVLRREGME